MPLVVIGLSHHNAPVTVRERFAFAEAEIAPTLAELKASGLAEEGVILSTCNRVELYVATELEADEAVPRLREFLLHNRRCDDEQAVELYAHVEPRSVEHLFKVAGGLDSMVLGETEILGQLKQAYDLALRNQHTGRRLNKAFQRAFNVAKLVRTETNIQRGSISVGSVAVELAEKIFDRLDDKRVMVIGAGDTSEKTARALLSRGARHLIVSNRTFERAEALAGSLGGSAVAFDRWAEEFAHIDIIISSTSAPGYLIDRARLKPLMKGRGNHPLLLIDIAVPRDIEPEVNFMENIFLYNVDDLQAIADDYLAQRKEEIGRCEAIIRDKLSGLFDAPPSPGKPAPARRLNPRAS